MTRSKSSKAPHARYRSWVVAFGLLFMCLLRTMGFAGESELLRQPAPYHPINQAFRHILPNQMESLGYINAIAQDHDGFIWIGGSNGLARFDGYDLHVFTYDNENPVSLSHNYVTDILVTKTGDMWVATLSGLNIFDRRTETFTVFKYDENDPKSISGNSVRSLLEDRNGHIWAGAEGGLNRYDVHQKRFVRYNYEENPSANQASDIIHALAEDREGVLWVGTQNNGLVRYNPQTKNYQYYRHDKNNPHSLPADEVRDVFVEGNGTLWLATKGGGPARYNPGTGQFETFKNEFSSNKPLDTFMWQVLKDSQGRVWFGGDTGLYLFVEEEQAFIRYRNDTSSLFSMGNPGAFELFEDKVGDLWIGMFPSGVDVLDAQATVFRGFKPEGDGADVLLNLDILASLEDSKKNIWAGSGYGLVFVDRAKHKVSRIGRFDETNVSKIAEWYQNGLPLNLPAKSNSEPEVYPILSMIEDKQGWLWVGIWSDGIWRVNLSSGEWQHHMPVEGQDDTLCGIEPWGLHEAHDGSVWVATERGVCRFDPTLQRYEFYHASPDMLDGDRYLYSRVVYEDSKNKIWIGSTHGLFQLDPTTKVLTRYQTDKNVPNGLRVNFVKAIHEDSQQRFWVGTHGGGVHLMDRDNGSFKVFNVDNGLADNVITDIVEDDEGYIWFSTPKGLSRYSVVDKSFRNFNQNHGLPGNLFNRPSAGKTSYGELMFGSTRGFTLFNPANILRNMKEPSVVFTELQVDNNPVLVDSEGSILDAVINEKTSITLAPHNNVFSLSYAALNYRLSEENQYAYILEGFDDDWQYVGEKRIAKYTNIDPGSYTFRVRASNNDGVWNNTGKSIDIHILPYFWQTWWAYSLYVVLFLLLVAVAVRVHLRRKDLERQLMLNQRVKELDKLKDEFLANTSHELRTPMNGIIGLAEAVLAGAAGEISDDVRKHLDIIVLSGRRLVLLVNDILDASKLQSRTLKLNKVEVKLHHFFDMLLTQLSPLIDGKPVVLENKVSEDIPVIFADDARLQQIFYNLVGNAIKFTETGSIVVSAHLVDDYIAVHVADTGVGIPSEKIDSIFKAYEQLDDDPSFQYGGTGLGLTVTRQLVELHGGMIKVRSTLGIGSVFEVYLPLNASAK